MKGLAFLETAIHLTATPRHEKSPFEKRQKNVMKIELLTGLCLRFAGLTRLPQPRNTCPNTTVKHLQFAGLTGLPQPHSACRPSDDWKTSPGVLIVLDLGLGPKNLALGSLDWFEAGELWMCVQGRINCASETGPGAYLVSRLTFERILCGCLVPSKN